MQAIKMVGGAVGSVLTAIAGMALIVLLIVAFTHGMQWISENLVWYFITASQWGLLICLGIFLPLSIFRFSRKVSCFGFMIASMVFGACTWFMGFLIAYDYWGFFAVVLGLMLAVVGMVPVGILASAFHGDWASVGILVGGLVVTYGARVLSAWLAVKIDNTEEEERIRRTALPAYS